LVSGGATAQTVTGDGSALGDVDAIGISLGADSDITIGKAGNITGLAVVGTLTNGTLGDSVDITASTTDGAGSAESTFTATGILGTDNTNLTAGPNDGDVSGQAFAGGSVMASNVGNSGAAGSADAKINSSVVTGIQDVDILGGMVGSNLVRGTALGNFEATATSVWGSSDAISTTAANGIFGDGSSTLTTSGNISAIAQLTNTVTATTVHGSATAQAVSDAVGLSGYNVTIIGSGALNASAISKSASLASSVGGGVSA